MCTHTFKDIESASIRACLDTAAPACLLFPFRGITSCRSQAAASQPIPYLGRLQTQDIADGARSKVLLLLPPPAAAVNTTTTTIADRRLLLRPRLPEEPTAPSNPNPPPCPPGDRRQAAVDRIVQYLDLAAMRHGSGVSSSSSVGCTGSRGSSAQVTPKGSAAAAAAAAAAATKAAVAAVVGLRVGSQSQTQQQQQQQQPSPGMYVNATACEHSSDHKRLRVKKGFIYYVCYCCGAKWRVPALRRQQRALRSHEVVVPPQQDKLASLMEYLNAGGYVCA